MTAASRKRRAAALNAPAPTPSAAAPPKKSPPPPPRSATRQKRPECIATPLDQYELQEVVGEGTFSVVRKAKRLSDAATVAVKRLKKVDQAASRIRDEISCLRALSGCAQIAELLDCHRADGQVDIVLPYFAHCDFADALAADRFTPYHTRAYLRGLFVALAHMHERGFACSRLAVELTGERVECEALRCSADASFARRACCSSSRWSSGASSPAAAPPAAALSVEARTIICSSSSSVKSMAR